MNNISQEKQSMPLDGVEDYIDQLLQDMQADLFAKAKAYRDEHITKADTMDEMQDILTN